MILSFSNFKKVGFPHEHGSWGFFLEPIVLALLISYTKAGAFLALCSFFLFLAYQPVSYIIKGHPKYLIPSAFLFLSVYVLISALLFSMALNYNVNFEFIYPFISGLMLMILFKLLEWKNLNRKLIVELIPQLAVSLFSVAILVINNSNEIIISGFICIVLARSIQTVFYINNKLKFFKGYTPDKVQVNTVGFGFMILLIIFSFFNITPWISVIGVAILISRSFIGFKQKNKNEKVKIIGIKEFIYGFLLVILNTIGYNYLF